MSMMEKGGGTETQQCVAASSSAFSSTTASGRCSSGNMPQAFLNSSTSVWLRNAKEEELVQGVTSSGKVPIWISGSLINNGPGGIDVYGKDSLKHWYDGPGCLQKFTIHGGTATYSSRFIQSKSFIANMEAQKLVYSEFGTVASSDPSQTILARIAAVFLGPLQPNMSDNANFTIHPFGDEIYSLSEFPFAHRIDPENLDTTHTVNVHEYLGMLHQSSHPHVWGRKVYNLGQRLTLWHGPQYLIAEMDGGGGRGRMNKMRRPSASPTPLRSRSGSMVTTSTIFNPDTHSGRSSIASSVTNLSSLQQSFTVEQDHDKLDDDMITKPQSTSSIRTPWNHARIVATFPSRWPLSLCYMHSFSITPNYFVVIEQPLAIFLPTVPLTQISGRKSLASCLKFYPEEDTLFHVISRHGGKKAKRSSGGGHKARKSFKSSSFFFLHTINAYEVRDGESRDTLLIVDICCHKDPSIIESLYVDVLKNSSQNPDNVKTYCNGRPKRFLITFNDRDKSKSKDKNAIQCAESELIVDIGCESPTINRAFNGKPYNFFYAISSEGDRDTLIKVDVLKKTYETWNEPHGFPSEPIFVPRPTSQREDDGVVLSTIIYDKESVRSPNSTSLLVLNANTWDLIAKVDFTLESTVPKPLHGWFFPTKTPPLTMPGLIEPNQTQNR